MSSYWDNEIVRVALPLPYEDQRTTNEARYKWLGALVDGLVRQQGAISEQLLLLRPMMEEAKALICMGCGGSGKVRLTSEHSEAKIVDCKACNGSGNN